MKMQNMDWIYGLVIGDGWICPPRGNTGTSYFRVSHSTRQLEYIEWKAQKLESMGFQAKLRSLYYVHDKRNGKSYPACTVTTNQSKFWAEIRAEMYSFRNTPTKTRKRITKPLLKKWTLNTLLLLYLDDGYNYKDSNAIHLYTYQHPYEEQVLLRDWIYDITGAEMYIRTHKDKLHLATTKDGEVFRSALREVFPDISCMKYKMYHYKSEELTDTPMKIGD
jgi:hypothetical protein